MQRRAIFFVFDGGVGLGHLRRLSLIAKAMQGPFACLIVTGHRAAAHWFVPAECEYVHLPAWDSLLPEKSAYWGRAPFVTLDRCDAVRLRRDLLRGVVEAFAPDVMIVDHLPLGMHDELGEIVAGTRCAKYLVTRGVQNETEDLDRLLLAGAARAAIAEHYDRVLLAIDPRILDFAARYPALDGVAGKFRAVGYVVAPAAPDDIAATRRARGLNDGDRWVVASAGGGQTGETLIAASCDLALAHPDIRFDIAIGPRSRLSRDVLPNAPNLRLHDAVADLAPWHAAADIVISSGGYNTLLETLQGRARIVCVPNRKSERDEQYAHAARLGTMAAIHVDLDVTQLPTMFARALSDPTGDRRAELDMAGAGNIARLLLADLAGR